MYETKGEDVKPSEQSLEVGTYSSRPYLRGRAQAAPCYQSLQVSWQCTPLLKIQKRTARPQITILSWIFTCRRQDSRCWQAHYNLRNFIRTSKLPRRNMQYTIAHVLQSITKINRLRSWKVHVQYHISTFIATTKDSGAQLPWREGHTRLLTMQNQFKAKDTSHYTPVRIMVQSIIWKITKLNVFMKHWDKINYPSTDLWFQPQRVEGCRWRHF